MGTKDFTDGSAPANAAQATGTGQVKRLCERFRRVEWLQRDVPGAGAAVVGMSPFSKGCFAPEDPMTMLYLDQEQDFRCGEQEEPRVQWLVQTEVIQWHLQQLQRLIPKTSGSR